ncbi:taspase, threonine aspartase, 1, partial [Modicella reniformis]
MTGAGEQITKTLLAKTCMDIFSSEDDTTLAANKVLDKFISSPLLRTYDGRHAGYIAVKLNPTVDVSEMDDDSDKDKSQQKDNKAPRIGEFIFAHTTKTMGVAFMSVQDNKPT